MTASENKTLPDPHSPDLILSHPTSNEHLTIWTSTSALWADSLTTLPLYIKESQLLATAPLARDGGVTTWILVDKNLPADKREILSSCETFRKRSLTGGDAEGNVVDNIVHGIASVFCPPEYRGRGYAQRMMRELAKVLFTWQTTDGGTRCIGSILYSDIGKRYYAQLGWHPNNKSNVHVEFRPCAYPRSALIKEVRVKDLKALCKRDEALLRKWMARPSSPSTTCTDTSSPRTMTIIPDVEHMGWHLAKEEFACKHLFSGVVPHAKGAIAGDTAGSQVWAIWTHRYYSRPDGGGVDAQQTNNVLYILRLVMEADGTASRLLSDASNLLDGEKYAQQIGYLKAVLQAAQAEALEWKLDVVQLWDPTPLVRGMLMRMGGLGHVEVEREDEGVACGLWYDEKGEVGGEEALVWVNNEHYAWV